MEETAPIGPVAQGPFLTQMLVVETALEPRGLLEALLLLEASEGRIRVQRWGPRTLDCDIVLYADRVIREPTLVVPHPELANRDFWQRELAELGIDWEKAVNGAKSSD